MIDWYLKKGDEKKMNNEFDSNQENQENQETQEKPKKPWLIPVIIGVVLVLFAGAGVAVAAKFFKTAGDPKETVVAAFKKTFSEPDKYPIDEIFGMDEITAASRKAGYESGLTLKLEEISEPQINQFAGSGFTMAMKADPKSKKSQLTLGAIYNGMDLASMNVYYGDEMLMLNLPELSSKVLTLDVSEGLAGRMQDSPLVGPLLEQSEINAEGIVAYLDEVIKQAEEQQASGKTPFDLEALMTRYKEGSKAQANFKEALTVVKGEGKQGDSQAYDVQVSKAAMIEFLRSSSDFFLNDEVLREDFLKQLEQSAKMTELVISGYSSELSAAQVQAETEEEVRAKVDDIIRQLEHSLTDVSMTVYVDKKGNLTAVDAVTVIKGGSVDMPDESDPIVDVNIHWEFAGGSYPTQNMAGTIALNNGEAAVSMDYKQSGAYEKGKLTCDVEVKLSVDEEPVMVTYSGSYDEKAKNFAIKLDVAGQEDSRMEKVFDFAVDGRVDELSKGKSFRISMDSIRMSVLDGEDSVELSGELHCVPLTGDIAPLEGTAIDVLEANQQVFTGLLFEIIGNLQSLGVLNL